MCKVQKNYRLDEVTLREIEYIKNHYIKDDDLTLQAIFKKGLTETDVVCLAINQLYIKVRFGEGD